MDKEIVMYVRGAYCGSVALARDLLKRYNISYREINIDDDPLYAAQLKEWINFFSVPTLIIANSGENVPYTECLPRPADQPLRGYSRGPMITEPNNQQLEDWLHQHGFLDKPYRR
ncbi:MAG: glutaredoxin [Anaerolineae bacterium]